MLKAGDNFSGAHGGSLHFFLIDKGGFLRAMDLADAERFCGADNASDIVGGANAIEVDGDVGKGALGYSVARADHREKVVFF